MTKETFATLHSVGVKTNRQVARVATNKKVKATKPSASKLKALGYTASQREAILDAYKEL